MERHPAETVFALVESVRRGERELRFDERGPVALLWRGFDRALATLQLRSWNRRGTPTGRLLEGLRQRLLGLRHLAWKAAPAQRPISSRSRAGTLRRSLPASNR